MSSNNNTSNVNPNPESEGQLTPIGYDGVAQVQEELSKYIKIQAGQKKVLLFLRYTDGPNKGKPRMYRHDGFIVKEENGQKVKKPHTTIAYDVKDPNSPLTEKQISFSLSWALNLNELLKEDYSLIKISRTGASLDTNYNFVPVKEETIAQQQQPAQAQLGA